ncbi:hypothetical protein BsWGS_24762 [Bradybaena similaris]
MSAESKKQFRHSDTASDSDGSEDDNLSLISSQLENTAPAPAPAPAPAAAAGKVQKKRTGSSRNRKTNKEWDVIEGLKAGQKCEEKPEKYQGYLMKKRKWPLKGWHKRFFVLERGILTYAKTSADIQKGKYHGIMDIGLAVITYKHHNQLLDIDAEEQVHHIKVKEKALFEELLNRLRHHRLYRQHELVYGVKDASRQIEITSPAEEMPKLTNANLPELALQHPLKKEIIRQASFKDGQGRVIAWLLGSSGFEQSGKTLQSCQSDINELQNLLEKIQTMPISTDSGLEGVSHTSATNLLLSPQPSERLHSSASNPNLLQYSNGTNISSPVAISSEFGSSSSHTRGRLASGASSAPVFEKIQEIKLRESFLSRAEILHAKFKDLLSVVASEKDRIRTTFEQDSEYGHGQILSLKNSLIELQKQNTDLRGRLARIHADSYLIDGAAPAVASPMPSVRIGQEKSNIAQSMSLDNFSLSEYYDAEENFGTISDSSTEASDEEASSEVSDDGNDTDYTAGGTSVSEVTFQSVFATGRRSRLPVPKPASPVVSLFNLMYRNIGKDLTKISMPVTLNEPLSMLQRLCEELEYSELLDKAAEYDDPYERMMYVAAFAVSSYASSYYREGHKPFNPLLGETYECIREDKGWRFIAEQVSHHPPVSACHCESKNFKLWQDVRIKTKFWGKSMEIQPLGHVHLVLPKYRDHYRWNKVTTCVHNLLGGQRWADQYGEMTITNGNIVCKLTFTKGSNNTSPKRYEILGTINSSDGKVAHNLFGKWNEAFFCGHATSAKCIWRPGAMPESYELYYGFTRFAMELNELDPDMSKFLPPTDTRFRPDQRLLEEGKVAEAEAEKHRLENAQRDRRRNLEASGVELKPLWFKKIEASDKSESYEYTNKYWESRKDPGFACMSFIQIY